MDDTPDLTRGEGRWKVGDHVLVYVRADPALPAGQYRGDVAATVAVIKADLLRAASVECNTSTDD